MTQIVEGRMIVKRINTRIPSMKGEAIIRNDQEVKQPAPKDQVQVEGE